ncbi:MAG: hypothetical protein ACRESK_02210, partial [Gammaproteobacteria bacterium]
MEQPMINRSNVRNLSVWFSCLLLFFFQQAYAATVNLPDFTPLVEANSAAVVNISTTLKKTGKGHPPIYNMPDIPEDSPLYEFFKKFFGEIPDGGLNPFEQRSSLGSG